MDLLSILRALALMILLVVLVLVAMNAWRLPYVRACIAFQRQHYGGRLGPAGLVAAVSMGLGLSCHAAVVHGEATGWQFDSGSFALGAFVAAVLVVAICIGVICQANLLNPEDLP